MGSKKMTAGATIAAALLAFAVAGCAFPKAGSLTLSQPGGIGPVRIHFTICEPGNNLGECGETEESETIQYLIGVAVPPGSNVVTVLAVY